MTIVYKPKGSETEELLNYKYVQGFCIYDGAVVARMADGNYVKLAEDLTPDAAKNMLNKIKISILDKDRIVGLL